LAKALVTGGAGFIGSHLVRALLARGDQVCVLDDLSTGRQANLAGLDLKLIIGDVRDFVTVSEAMADVDLVFHQAAMISVPASMEDPLNCYAINLQGSLYVLWAAHQAGVSRVVLASSAAVYGETTGKVSETVPTSPLSTYATSKLAMEQAARLFTLSYDLPTVSLRYFNVYGPRQSPDSPYAAAIPIFIDAMLAGEAPEIYGDGQQRRDFVFVEDVVRANILASEQDGAIGGVFNIGGGNSISILDLVHTLQRFFPVAPSPTFGPPRAGDIRFSQADMTRAEKALGYRPKIDLEQGLHTTVQWFRASERRANL
jgi:UDP-glucose 4-epimerase